jgi:UDP-N-acetylglucosamine enolpyruvyl transferase
MIEILKAVIASVLGGGIAYGYMKAEINQIKAAIQQYQTHAERLSAIEAKIDIILKQFVK